MFDEAEKATLFHFGINLHKKETLPTKCGGDGQVTA